MNLHVVPLPTAVTWLVLTNGVAVVVDPAQNKSHAAVIVFLTVTTIAISPDLFNVTENVDVQEAVLIRSETVVKLLLS